MPILSSSALASFLCCLAAAMASPFAPVVKNAPEVAVRPASTGLFVVIYRQGPGWKAERPMQGQALGGHLRYYRRGIEDGRVFAAGGLLAINGGLAILRAATLAEARAFVTADPAVLKGTLAGEVHAWTASFVSREPLRP